MRRAAGEHDHLAAEESRYVTGVQLRVDAGGHLGVNEFHQ